MKAKLLRIERFLCEMESVIPWSELTKIIRPYYRRDGGRPPHDLLLMLRIHFLQLWHNLSDPATEEAIYDRLSFQKFLGFDCFGGVVPDESSICRFRHLLEEHGIVFPILIYAPSSCGVAKQSAQDLFHIVTKIPCSRFLLSKNARHGMTGK